MADRGHELTDSLIEEIERKVAKEYEQAANEMQKKVDDYFAKFKVKDRIKQRALDRDEITWEEYKQWRYGQVCVGERWKEMRDTLAQDLTNTDSIARSIIGDFMPEAYALNHNFATYQVEHDALIDTSYTLYNRRTVENLLKDNPTLLPYPRTESKTAKRLRERADLIWNRQHISSAITQGVLQGESIPKIAKRLEKVVGMDKSAAVRNARTMMTGCQNKGRQDAYDDLKEKGIDIAEIWIATLDSRTRHSHRHLHGTYKDPKTGEYDNGLEYPGDPMGDPAEVYNCRCTEIAEVEGVHVDIPKYSPKMKGMTFDEWLNGKSYVVPQPQVDYVGHFGGMTYHQALVSLPKDVGLKVSKLASAGAKQEGMRAKDYWEQLVNGDISNSEIDKILSDPYAFDIPTSEWIERMTKRNPNVDGMLQIEEKFFNLMSEEERGAVKIYSGSSYDSINTHLRRIGAGLESHASERIVNVTNLCHDALSKCELEDQLYLRRGTDLGDLAGLFMQGDFDRNMRSLSGKTAEELNDMFQGQIGTYFGFTSTSSQWDLGFEGDVEVVLSAPKGTKAASIMRISKYGTGEGETLLCDNTRVICEKIESAPDGHFGADIRVFLSIIPG